MSDYEKAYIYFDTNALECRHSGKSLFLSKININPMYYEIEDLIRRLGLSEKVGICIPEIVWLEFKEHMISHFKSERTSMDAKIESFQKTFGDLVEIYCDFKECKAEEQCLKYLECTTKEFLDNPRVTAKIVPYPRDEETISKIIQQAIQSTKPFRTVKTNKKDYTDAGFKDALIFNTIKKNTGEHLGILVSNDTDLIDLVSGNRFTNIRLCKTAKDVQQVLSKEFDIVTADMIESILESNDYIMKTILNEVGLRENVNCKIKEIISSNNTDDGIKAKLIMFVNNEEYAFEILYNIEANELIEASCEPLYESEVG